ncbi:MAG TPA: bifunctional adenosylcobinamide kinase/adenosylcobinamide-phosphate guanylyltransferase [Terriglobia bacterium]|nr:bifunctional adenosylcobinamide kinase/adenosylcobinamide-phosphate guanylyltransferase [Terriglobia bacterium]
MITLITGGARSGKTRYALENAGQEETTRGGFDDCTYIATAELRDDEMRERAVRHQRERSHRWRTIEEPFELAARMTELSGIVIIDCLTMWLSNWMLRDETQLESQIESFCASLRLAACHVRAITNEVGSSIVPDNPLARRFRDWAGVMNQRVASIADRVYLMVCGFPVQLK